jgi:hypothetical protein
MSYEGKKLFCEIVLLAGCLVMGCSLDVDYEQILIYTQVTAVKPEILNDTAVSLHEKLNVLVFT